MGDQNALLDIIKLQETIEQKRIPYPFLRCLDCEPLKMIDEYLKTHIIRENHI